jgi:hypothetical protein
LDEVAPKVAGKLAIGKIDCTKEKSLCSQYKVKGYPTLKFYRDGDFYDYPGGRKAEDIINFANKMSQPAVKTVKSLSEAMELIGREDPSIAFLLHDQTMKGTTLQEKLQSTLLAQVFSQVARKQQALANFLVLTPASEETETDSMLKRLPNEPFIVKIEPGVAPVLYELDKNKEPSSLDLIDFVRDQNVPLVTAFGPNNFHKIGRIGRPLVIGCIDGSSSTQIEAMEKELRDYATIGPAAITSRYYFGWMDGKSWQRFLDQFRVDELPQYLVVHVPSKVYYQNTTFTTVKTFLEGIEAGLISSKDASRVTGWRAFFQHKLRFFFDYMPWSMVGVVALVAILIIALMPHPDSQADNERTEADKSNQDNDEQEQESKKDR